MRESNFAFPAQNKACVCITSQLYDRRGAFCPFLFSSLQFQTNCYSYSTGHHRSAATVQLVDASDVSNLDLAAHPRDHDHGRRPRAARAHPARVLHLPPTPREPCHALRIDTPVRAAAQADTDVEPADV